MAGVGKETDFDMEAAKMQAEVLGKVVADMAAAGMEAAGMEVVDTEQDLLVERMVAVDCTGGSLVDR